MTGYNRRVGSHPNRVALNAISSELLPHTVTPAGAGLMATPWLEGNQGEVEREGHTARRE